MNPMKNRQFQIRRMIPEDISEVFRIDAQTAALYWPENSYHFEVERNDASRCWVAVNDNGSILGFLILWLIVDEIHVANFAVSPEYQGLGIGTALMIHGLISAWKEGARVSFLEVRAGNLPAITIYQKLGYEPVGIRENYYQDNHEDAIMMNLESEAYTKLHNQQE